MTITYGEKNQILLNSVQCNRIAKLNILLTQSGYKKGIAGKLNKQGGRSVSFRRKAPGSGKGDSGT
jgi:hypothetical protein